MQGDQIKRAVLVFAKAPISGKAKTRLIPLLGAEQAANFQAELINLTLNKFSPSAMWKTQLWCALDPQHPVFLQNATVNNIVSSPQVGADLGERMYRASRSALREFNHVVIVGTDSPVLSEQDVREAFVALEKNDVVVKPAEDGGYVLIGLKKAEMKLFSGIDWGQATVFQQTLSAIHSLGWKVNVMSTGWDIDEPADYLRWQKELGFTDCHTG